MVQKHIEREMHRHVYVGISVYVSKPSTLNRKPKTRSTHPDSRGEVCSPKILEPRVVWLRPAVGVILASPKGPCALTVCTV